VRMMSSRAVKRFAEWRVDMETSLVCECLHQAGLHAATPEEKCVGRARDRRVEPGPGGPVRWRTSSLRIGCTGVFRETASNISVVKTFRGRCLNLEMTQTVPSETSLCQPRTLWCNDATDFAGEATVMMSVNITYRGRCCRFRFS